MATYQEDDSWSEPRILAESEGASPASCFALPIGDDSRVFIGWQCDNRLAYTTGRRDEWSPMVQTQLTLGPTKHDHHLGTDNLLVRSHDDEYILLTKMDGKLYWCTIHIRMRT